MDLLKLCIILVTLSYTSILDIKYREVNPRIWLYAGIPLAFITIVVEWIKGFPRIDLIYMLINLIIVLAAVGGLYYTNLMGGGDLFSLVIIAYSNPINPLVEGGFLKNSLDFNMPFIIPVLLYSSLIAILYAVILSVYNLVFNRSEVKRLPRRIKILYITTAKPIRVRDLIEKRFWYPLERPWSKNRFRFTFNVEEDDAEVIRKIKRMLNKGRIKPEDKLWCTYGLPFILFITIGIAISFAGGDIILTKLLTTLMS